MTVSYIKKGHCGAPSEECLQTCGCNMAACHIDDSEKARKQSLAPLVLTRFRDATRAAGAAGWAAIVFVNGC